MDDNDVYNVPRNSDTPSLEDLTPPPRLMPKKGQSFRIHSAMLDPLVPKVGHPVPKMRKSSIDLPRGHSSDRPSASTLQNFASMSRSLDLSIADDPATFNPPLLHGKPCIPPRSTPTPSPRIAQRGSVSASHSPVPAPRAIPVPRPRTVRSQQNSPNYFRTADTPESPILSKGLDTDKPIPAQNAIDIDNIETSFPPNADAVHKIVEDEVFSQSESPLAPKEMAQDVPASNTPLDFVPKPLPAKADTEISIYVTGRSFREEMGESHNVASAGVNEGNAFDSAWPTAGNGSSQHPQPAFSSDPFADDVGWGQGPDSNNLQSNDTSNWLAGSSQNEDLFASFDPFASDSSNWASINQHQPSTTSSIKVEPKNLDTLIDLDDFDPLRSTKSSDPDSSAFGKAIELDMSMNASVPVDQSVANPPTTPEAYIELDETDLPPEDMYTQIDKVETQETNQLGKPTKPLKASPSFHFEIPEAPPPPFPRIKDRLAYLPPPPVPPRPRPTNLVVTAASPQPPRVASPQATTTTSAILDELPTPLFEGSQPTFDPFQDTEFDNVCNMFNKGHPDSAAQMPSSVSSTPSPAAPSGSNMDGFAESGAACAAAEPSPALSFDSGVPDDIRISQFVIPAPGSSSGDPYSSDNDSESDFFPNEDYDGRTQGVPDTNVTIMDSGPPTPKKNTRCGYLAKQGGFNANKGWKKRWVVFNGTNLSYYSDNKAQVSKRIIPVACMKEIQSDVRDQTSDRHCFRFNVLTSLKDRVFVFAAESLEDCLLWANFLMAAITEYKKSLQNEPWNLIETLDKEGFIRFNTLTLRKYYVSIRGKTLSYYHSFEDFQMGSPIHQIDMKLASVKVKDKKRFKMELWLHYGHFEKWLGLDILPGPQSRSHCYCLTFESEQDMQQWCMAMEDAIAEGLADDTVLEKVYQNISNKHCADCGAVDPHWASINLGIVVCKNCAGIHRMFEYKVSKIRSLRMDTRVWTPSLIELMVTIGNANANAFWEFNVQHSTSKLQPNDPMERRKDWITKKYLNKRFCNLHPLANNKTQLGEELLEISKTDMLLEAMQILFSGANVLHRKSTVETETAYELAKENGKRLIMELLYQNGGDTQGLTDNADDENRLREDVRLQGFLNKTPPGGKIFEKRWFILEHGTLTYYPTEKSNTIRGSIDRKNMMFLCEANLDREDYHFDISTNSKDNRLYSFSTSSKSDAGEWMRTIAKLMAPVAIMENVGMIDIRFAGFAHFRESLASEWLQTFLVFSWRGLYFMNKNLMLDYIDLRKSGNISLQDVSSGFPGAAEMGPCFVISFTGRSIYLQAPLVRDTERMYSSLSDAIKTSGRTLQDQALTQENVPVIVDRCITQICKTGLDERGIYRSSAQNTRIQQLLDDFRKDAYAVSLNDYTSDEVANALKRFLRELDDSVFERINYQNWMNMAASNDIKYRQMWYKYLVDKMPLVNHCTLKRIILHLNHVAHYEAKNQMNAQNLAVCFAPSLLRTNKDEIDVMSDMTSREIHIIIDLMTYQDYFFHIEENEKKIEDNIKKAQRKIQEEMLKNKQADGDVSNTSGFLIPVYLMNGDGQSVNIQMTTIKQSSAVIEEFKRSTLNSGKNVGCFGLFEVLCKGSLVRPMFPDELVSPTIQRWFEWGGIMTADNSVFLCARDTEMLDKLDAKYNPSHILLAELKYSDPKRKSFKKYYIGFRQCKLAIYKDSKATSEIVSWRIEDLAIYMGLPPKRASAQNGLTFMVKGEKIPKTAGQFGHSICFETEVELHRWAAALFVAQNPRGLLTWSY